ncbi:MAG: hypothetical protein JSV80_17680 [Acidobacteriota bacterium]|nr:MAG: hypothetical protein JSV80_17680 [Acidobacteriota bacterium]
MTTLSRTRTIALLSTVIVLTVGSLTFADPPILEPDFATIDLGVEDILSAGTDQPETDGVPPYDLVGTWYGKNSVNEFYVMTIERTGVGRFNVTSLGNRNPDPLGWGSTMVTPFGGEIVSVGINEYETTMVTHYGDESVSAMYSAVTNGTLTQTGPDTFVASLYAEMSCNPCWVGCWKPPSMCDPAKAWDPFDDPYASCFSDVFNPVLLTYERVPIDEPCTPPES